MLRANRASGQSVRPLEARRRVHCQDPRDQERPLTSGPCGYLSADTPWSLSLFPSLRAQHTAPSLLPKTFSISLETDSPLCEQASAP